MKLHSYVISIIKCFQALGINGGDRDQLDSFLVTAFQKNIPPNFNLLNASTTSSNCASKLILPFCFA